MGGCRYRVRSKSNLKGYPSGPHFPLPLSLMFGFSELRPSNGGVTLSAKTGSFWPETLLRGKNFFFQKSRFSIAFFFFFENLVVLV